MISLRPPVSAASTAAVRPADVLVVYYSFSGVTEAVARRIAARFSADLLALDSHGTLAGVNDASPGRPLGLLGRLRALREALHGARVAAPPRIEPRRRLVLVLAPIWLFGPAPPLVARLREVDWGGAAVFGIFTYATVYAPHTARVLAESVEARGGRYMGHAGLRLRGADDPALGREIDALIDAHLPAWRLLARLDPERPTASVPAPRPASARVGGSILVSLKPRGSLPPLFCVTSGYGDVLALAALASRMAPERPFYALQPPPELPAEPLAGPEAIARRRVELCCAYADAIRSVTPRGPYHLAGYSAGALMATVVAAHLRGIGDEVRHLILLDPPGGVPPWEYRLFVRARALVQRHIPKLAPDRARILHVYHAYFTDAGFLHHVGAVTGYTPHRAADRVTFVTARDSLMRFTIRILRWRAALGDALEFRSVPGDHLTFLRPPHVDALAACIRDLLGD